MEKVTEIEAVSSGSDWFEWVILKHCHAATVTVTPSGKCRITEMHVNGKPVNITWPSDPAPCNQVVLDREFMLRPHDRVRVTVTARRGTKLSGCLRMTWLS